MVMSGRLSERARSEIRRASSNVAHFAQLACGVTLRPYQKEAAEAIIRSVFARDGKTFILIFSRQSEELRQIKLPLNGDPVVDYPDPFDNHLSTAGNFR